jgi:hypothetical protein
VTFSEGQYSSFDNKITELTSQRLGEVNFIINDKPKNNSFDSFIQNLSDGIDLNDFNSETKELLLSIFESKNEIEFSNAINVLAQSHSLATKRLDRAVEVDFKAYLPAKAPILYKEWKKLPENKGKNALDCLEELYGTYLEQGVLYQDDLGGKDGLDPGLIQAIKNYCNPRKIDYKAIIKSKQDKTLRIAEKITPNLFSKIKNIRESYKKRKK